MPSFIDPPRPRGGRILTGVIETDGFDTETKLSADGITTIVTAVIPKIPVIPGQDGIDGQDGIPGPPGAVGPPGATGAGVQGPPGPPGADGTDGQDGIPGAPGNQGPDGATGPAGAGLQGPPGQDGADGNDGSPGPAGPAGATGATGNDGASIVGPPGPPGSDGNDGNDGIPGAAGPQGSPGNDGAPGVAGAAGVPGQDGQDGNDGAPGPAGPSGQTGPTGATGNDGAPGLPGFGVPGQDGNDGNDGIPGPAGPPGATGPTGPAGAPSTALLLTAVANFGTTAQTSGTFDITGLSGLVLNTPILVGPAVDVNDPTEAEQSWAGTGYAINTTTIRVFWNAIDVMQGSHLVQYAVPSGVVFGMTGPIGPPGQDGIDGYDGIPGSAGLAGVNGLDGSAGPPGPPGSDGIDGYDGIPGPPGSIGPQGIQGSAGPTGIPGAFIPGQDGGDGYDGIPGPPGPIGPQGTAGTTGSTGPAGATPPVAGIILSATNQSLQIITNTGADIDIEASFNDLSAGVTTPGSSATNITTATTTTLVAAPAASTQRTIVEMSIVNGDASLSQIVTVQKLVAAATFGLLVAIPLMPAERIEFTSDRGWRVFDAAGREKGQGSGSTGILTISPGQQIGLNIDAGASGPPIALSGRQQGENIRFAHQFSDTVSSGAVANYSLPDGFTGVTFTPPGNLIIRGISSGTLNDGRIFYFSVSRLATFSVTLNHEDAGTGASQNRFNLPLQQSLVLKAGDVVMIWNDSVLLRYCAVLTDFGSTSIVNVNNTAQRAALTGDITATQNSNSMAFRSFAALSVLANATSGSAIPSDLPPSGNTYYQQLRVANDSSALEWGPQQDEQQCLVRDDFQVVNFLTSTGNTTYFCDTPWTVTGVVGTSVGMVGTPTGVSNHFGEMVLSTGTTINTSTIISKGVGLTTKIYKLSLVKEFVWIVSLDTVTQVYCQFGLGDNGFATATNGITVFMSAAAGVTQWHYFTASSGTTNDVSSGVNVVAAQRYLFRAVNIGGGGWTLTIDGAASHTIATTPVASVNFFAGHKTLDTNNKNMNFDYCHLLAGPLSR